MLADYRYIQRFRVPFGDVDMLQHVNNAAYVRWAEEIRSSYFREVLHAEIGGEFGLIVAKLEIVYERQMRHRDPVAICCRVSRMGRKSFDISYEIWNEATEARCAHLHTPMVAFDYTMNSTIVVPDIWRERIAAFEKTAVPIA
jgi:acyl-CoA thioester hydrolase